MSMHLRSGAEASSSLTKSWRQLRVKPLPTSDQRRACTCAGEELVVAAVGGRLGGCTCVGEELVVAAVVGDSASSSSRRSSGASAAVQGSNGTRKLDGGLIPWIYFR